MKFRKALRNQVTFRNVKEGFINEYELDFSDTEIFYLLIMVTKNHILQENIKQNQQLLVKNERLCVNSQDFNKKLKNQSYIQIYLEQFCQTSLKNTINYIIKYQLQKLQINSTSRTQRSEGVQELFIGITCKIYSKSNKKYISRCVSEPQRYRKIKLIKTKRRINDLRHQEQHIQGLSIIDLKNLSQLSQCLF
ncbi:unnamed protein product [Paramecium octaurelia]|uniref:Uncharacterized protein n=1 Tax=Paramecium octaurelia TaxID=43137 RepID=A0A8S1VBA4_PAROT|nr:unnamed protein product [Paramecium octaurelia]